MAAARDAAGGDEKVVAVIGDGSLTGGMAFEALNHAGHLKSNLIVILNDNEMSISPNVGALSAFLSRAMTSDLFRKARQETKHFLDHLPGFGKDLLDLVRRAEHSLKGFLTPGMLFEAFGFDYIGPIDGHRLDDLIETLRNATRIDGPVLIHVLTKKGKGYAPAESRTGPLSRRRSLRSGHRRRRARARAARRAIPACSAGPWSNWRSTTRGSWRSPPPCRTEPACSPLPSAIRRASSMSASPSSTR